MSFVSEFERRGKSRQGLFAAAQVQGRRRHSYGVTRNVSTRGLLLACQQSFEAGDEVEVVFKVNGEVRRATGRVVRSRLDLRDPWWPYMVALAIDEAPAVEREGAEAA